MLIRPERHDDAGLVALLYRHAFVGSYEAELVERLGEAGLSRVALVAETPDGELVGHVVFAAISVRLDTGDAAVPTLALAEMAVHDALRGQGIGGLLVRQGLDAARALGTKAVLVLGHPGYYPRFGFQAGLARRLRTPFVGGDALMAIELETGALGDGAGSVHYPQAFGIGGP